MISNENKKLAKWAMNYGLKQGCQSVRVSIYNGSDTELEVRDKQLDKLQQSSENQLVFNAYVDGRYGSFSTNRLEKRELGKFIEKAVESVRYLAVDNCRQLPDASLYFKGGEKSLEMLDPKFSNIDPDEKLAIVKSAAEEILGSDTRIISVQSSWSDGCSFGYTLTSNGFEGENEVSYYSLSVSVSIQGDGEARPEAYWYDQALTFDELQKKGIGKIALERALKKLGQKKVASGSYPMLVDNLNSERLFSPLVSAINGSALQQKNSFLLDKKGEKVLSEKVTVLDDPQVPHTFGARYFDNEGVATQKRYIFNKGVLETYFIDTYNSKKMNIPQTTGRPSRMVMELGNRSMEEIISGMEKGILVTGFNGGNCNNSSGDFSFGIEGFLIENGKLTQPVTEMNITGNMLTLWNSLSEIGNDPQKNRASLIPSLLFDNIDFSGL
jgi:PmbA protein